MPIKDALKVFKCKYCGKEYKMFLDGQGKLIYFPENYPWRVHGEYELMDHLKNDHKEQHEAARIFYESRTEEVKKSYAVS